MCSKCNTVFPFPRADLSDCLQYLKSQEKKFCAENDPLRPISKFDYVQIILRQYKKTHNIKTALDIGSHDGRFCHILESLNIEAYGIEPQQKVADYAQSRGLKVNSGYFPDKMPHHLEEIEYDFISCMESIYYFINIKESLQKIYDLLSDKGILLIKSHQGNSPYYEKGKSLFSRFGDYVQSIPTIISMQNWLEETGFKTLTILPYPTNFVGMSFGVIVNKFSSLHKMFGSFLFNNTKILNRADRIIIVACK